MKELKVERKTKQLEFNPIKGETKALNIKETKIKNKSKEDKKLDKLRKE